jgi:phospholipase/carboxylesterase
MLRPLLLTTAVILSLSNSCALGVYADLAHEPEGIEIRQGVAAGLHYFEVTPEGYPEDAALPMVVFLHGRGDRPPIPEGPFLGLDLPVRVILPRGPDRFGKGYAWMPVSAQPGESKALVRTLKNSGDRVAQALVELRRRHPTKGRPILVGFSQGGMIAFHVATHHPKAASEVFPLAGWLPPSLWPAGPKDGAEQPPIRAMHGTEDDVLRVDRTRHMVRRLREKGFAVELEEFDADHSMTEPMRQQLKTWVKDAIERRLGNRNHVPFA